MMRQFAFLPAIVLALGSAAAQDPAVPLPVPRPPLPEVRPADEIRQEAAQAGKKSTAPEGVKSEEIPQGEETPEGENTKAEAVVLPPVPQKKPAAPRPVNPETGAGSPSPLPAPAKIPVQAKPAFTLEGAKACEKALRKLNVAFTVEKPIKGPGQCGWPRPLKVTSLSRQVKVRGDIKLRCEVVHALARWSKETVVPSAILHLKEKPTAIEISTSYQCRRRNNARNGKLSEHAFANGVDMMAVRLESGKRIPVTDRRGSAEAERAFQAAIRGGSCAYFTTVLGPVTNASHADHFHLDLAVRRGGYRLCQ